MSYKDVLFCLCVGFVCSSVGLTISRPKDSTNLYTVLGSKFSIECQHEDLGIITWYRNAEELTEPYPQGLTIETSSDGYTETSVLSKMNVADSDLGIYGCESEGSTESITVKLLNLQVDDGLAQKPRGSAWLHCSDPDVPQGSHTYTIRWSKEGQVISELSGEKYAYHPENGSLEVRQIDYTKDLGAYSCEILDPSEEEIGTKSVNLSSIPHVRKFDERSKNLKKGASLRLTCSADGWPAPSLYWEKDGEAIEGDHVNIADDGKELNIASLEYSDRGEYYCFAQNGDDRVGNSSIMVRVKDPLGPLWPVLGIVIELALLAVIIVFYERRKAKQRAAEEQDDADTPLTENNDAGAASTNDGENIELRKRKT